MKGHGTKFGRKKEAAIAALLTHRNIEEAAKAVGIRSPTLIAWMKVPEFDQEYREARRGALRQSVARLQQASGAAVTTLLKIMVDGSATRVYAAARRRHRSGAHSQKPLRLRMWRPASPLWKEAAEASKQDRLQ